MSLHFVWAFEVTPGKTHVMLMCSEQKLRRQSVELSMNAGDCVIASSRTERLLGVHVQRNLKWTEYIRDDKNSLLNGLAQRLGGLKMISRFASFKARLTVANGIFRSKLIFMMPLWSGCSEYLVDALQVAQNKAARIVTRHDKSVSVQ